MTFRVVFAVFWSLRQTQQPQVSLDPASPTPKDDLNWMVNAIAASDFTPVSGARRPLNIAKQLKISCAPACDARPPTSSQPWPLGRAPGRH